jgi:hypothetical protein
MGDLAVLLATQFTITIQSMTPSIGKKNMATLVSIVM